MVLSSSSAMSLVFSAALHLNEILWLRAKPAIGVRAAWTRGVAILRISYW